MPPKPWENLYPRQADEAFNDAAGVTDDQWRALRPPLPQIEYLPPRFGYPSYVDRQWTVMQVFGITRSPSGNIPGMPSVHGEDRVDYSRDQATTQGSARMGLFGFGNGVP